MYIAIGNQQDSKKQTSISIEMHWYLYSMSLPSIIKTSSVHLLQHFKRHVEIKCCSRLQCTYFTFRNIFCQWRYWFVSLNPADSRSTILFLCIDEIERKALTWLRSLGHMYIRRSVTLNFRYGKDRYS
jgi:DNA polymerase III delta prime subunit